MGTRLQSSVSAGVAGEKGGAVQASGTDEPMATPTSGMLEGHKQVPFAGVSGNVRRGSKHAGAPIDSSANPSMPGDEPLTGHTFYKENSSKGNHPKRGPGRATKPSDAEKLATSGA